MKKFLTIVGLLTVVATPAFAQSYSHDFGTGNVIDTPALEQQAGRADANSAFAQAPEVSTRHKARVQSHVDSYSPANTGGVRSSGAGSLDGLLEEGTATERPKTGS